MNSFDGEGESSRSSRLEPQTDSTAEHLPSLKFDGASDQATRRRSSSLDCDRRRSDTVRLVRFASHLDLPYLHGDADTNSISSGGHHLHRDTPTTTFRNPFQACDTLDSRKPSDSSSDDSTYLRANAFAGHRDTLARIQRPHPTNNSGLSPVPSSSSSIDSLVLPVLHHFGGHWETFDHILFRRRTAPYASGAIIERLLRYTGFQDYLNLRLTCRQWYRALPEPSMPGSYRVPREVLQQVFSYLAPCDFDAARHTCRKWFDAGLDVHLLRMMLRTAQCQNAFKTDLRKLQDLQADNLDAPCMLRGRDSHPMPLAIPHAEQRHVSEQWLMSKRIATATRLSEHWRGPWSRRSISEGTSRFHIVEQVNFRRILVGLSSWDNSSQEKTFTTSTCSRYLLVISGHDIFVYDLRSGDDTLNAVVRLAADGNVMRVSMDTSSGRYAVAALLGNRTGLLWDLDNDRAPGQGHFHAGEPMSLGMRTEVYGPRLQDRTETLVGHLPLRRGEINSTLTSESYDSVNAESGGSDRTARHSLDLDAPNEVLESILDASSGFCATPESEGSQAGPSTGIAIQTRPAAIYRNLGSPDDAPRSVAICPSRKCVAFGCRLGIELHWVDALTAGDLNRWFPLAAPSDHLYFLPQRSEVDSSKKLRLISTAAGPSAPSTSRSESLPARLAVRSKTHDRMRRQSMTRLFFGSLPFPSAAVFPNGWRNDHIPSDDDRQGVLRTVDCDHYQAIPVSDGHHMLYTDPVNGLLCLGSDAPLGGPTKLVRKVLFVPPTVGDDGWAGLMSCYNAGQELQWGVRIVATHRDGRLILYNVPADLFSRIRHLRSGPDVWDEGAGVMAQSDLLMDDVLSAHPNTSTEPTMGNEASRYDSSDTPLRTVQIEGVEIGHVGRDIVDDVAVDTSNGGVRVWVFCRSGLARLLSIYVDSDHEMRQRFVGSDGLLYDAQAE